MKTIRPLFCMAVLAFLCVLPSMAKSDGLKFNKKNKFKIVQFTDVHWIYNNPASDEAGECMAEVLDAEKPDLVVFTGDVIFAKPAREALDKALEATVKRKIPFVVTWGNHDDEHDMNRKELSAYVAAKPGNLNTTTEGVSGECNFVLPVKSADGTKDAALLYMFDSHSYSTVKEIRGYGWIKHDQVDWYNRTSKQFTAANGGTPLPALAFFHIPLPEFRDAIRNESGFCVGTRKEKVSAPEINSGLGNAMHKAGDVMGIFVGHDHVNDYVAEWKGILMGYGRYTGGNTVYNGLPHGNGARVIEITEGSRAIKTWIRVKNGKVINEVDYPADKQNRG